MAIEKEMIDRNRLYFLYYKKKLSMVDAARRLRVTPAKVEYWMNKYEYPRRDPSQSAYLKQNADGDPFRIKSRLTPREKELFIAGIMLYWSEGGKSQKYSVQLANLDCKMLQVFLGFLRGTCNIKEKKLRLQVRLYQEFNAEKAIAYWSRLLKMPKNHISVHTHTDKRSNASKQRSPYGIATIQFSNMKLRKWLDETIEKYSHKLIECNKRLNTN